MHPYCYNNFYKEIAMFGFGHQIEEIKEAIDEIIEEQKDAVKSLKAEADKISSEANEQVRRAKAYIRDMLLLLMIQII
jgi:ElaB/YqjD/DUF883 family membrane-anchored ribosome-binding protein